MFQVIKRAFAPLALLCMFVATPVHSYILIDTYNVAEITRCDNFFGFKIPTYGNQYRLKSAGESEVRHPHRGYCGQSNYYGIGGENDFINAAGAGNTGKVISLFRTYWMDHVQSINLVGDTNTLYFLYDGIDNDPNANSYGLGGVNLTAETDNVLRLLLLTSTDVAEANITLSADGSNFSTVNQVIPNSENAYRYMDIPLSAFEDIANTTGTGVDLSAVNSIEIELVNTATSEGTVASVGSLVPNLAAYQAICSALGDQCFEEHFAIGLTQVEVTKQLDVDLSVSLLDGLNSEGDVGDLNGDGDIDSTDSDGDTVEYTVSINNTNDLLDAPANNVSYSASFAPDYATFIDNSVEVTVSDPSSMNVITETEVDDVQVVVDSIPDGETVTITYELKVDSGWQDTADISYSHYGSIDADEWTGYDLDPVVFEINEFDIDATLSVAAKDDSDGDGYSGPGEEVTFTASLTNVGPDSSDSVIFDFDAIPNTSLVAGSVTTNIGSVTQGNSGGDVDVEVSISNFAADAVATITFNVLIDDPFMPFSNGDDNSIGGQAFITDSSETYSGLSDDPDLGGAADPTYILVDAFTDRQDAVEDNDNDGLPENCDPACGDEDPNPGDTDNDGTPNSSDNDDDGDGTNDENDAYPFNPEADTDTDGDGQPDNCATDCGENLSLDNDDDNDGVPDAEDAFSPPEYSLADAYSASVDLDNDGLPDNYNDGSNGSIVCDAGCQSASLLTVDNDDDGDDRNDSSDDFPKNPAAMDDNDLDGYADAWTAGCDTTCQNNSGLELDPFVSDGDNDGVRDDDDDFPEDCYASLDSDGDGLPDELHDPVTEWCERDQGSTDLIADDDDDGDGVLDASDAFIVGPYVYAAALAASIDEDLDGYPDEWNASCGQECQDSSGLTLDPYLDDTDNDGEANGVDTDTDGDGILDVDEEEGFQYIDNNPPTVVAPADVEITAQGENTSVSLGQATATDIVQGQPVAISASADNTGPFAVGTHTVTWIATDAEGNVGSDTQTVVILPKEEEAGGNSNDGELKGAGGEGGSLSYLVILPMLALVFARRRHSQLAK